jgi:hypothetical protein
MASHMAIQSLTTARAPFLGEYSYLGIEFRPYFPSISGDEVQVTSKQRCDLFQGRETGEPGRPLRPSCEDAFRSVHYQAKAHIELSGLDRNIGRSLNRIAPGWRKVDIPRLVCRDESTMVAFDDSWSLVSWSHWWTQNHNADPSIQVVLLHADDHKDLTSPFLLQVGQQWRDPLTDRIVSFADPASVASAVASGCIGIGCFIVPLLHAVRSLQVRHLCASASVPVTSLIEKDLCADIRFVPTAPRLALREESCDTQLPCEGGSSYSGTHDPHLWLSNMPQNAAILLHIDLDYFNDRYGGGVVAGRREPTEKEMIGRIDKFCEALSLSGLQHRIENTTIALSPGFCPSEYWQVLLKTLIAGLRQIGCRCLPELTA